MTIQSMAVPQTEVTAYVDAYLIRFIETRKADAYALCDRIVIADDAAGEALLDQLERVMGEIRLAQSLLFDSIEVTR